MTPPAVAGRLAPRPLAAPAMGPASLMHLDLGCGSTPRNPYGRERLCGVDLQGAGGPPFHDFRTANLSLDPIPYDDDTFASVSAFDFIEHVPRILATPDGRGTRAPFIELMNEIWRVLAPGGRLYALTPAYPGQEAFQDPTHVNVISRRTHQYFCGDVPPARIYGFVGSFRVVRAEWAALPEAFSAEPPQMSWLRAWRHRSARLRRRLSHFLWELEAHKPR